MRNASSAARYVDAEKMSAVFYDYIVITRLRLHMNAIWDFPRDTNVLPQKQIKKRSNHTSSNVALCSSGEVVLKSQWPTGIWLKSPEWEFFLKKVVALSLAQRVDTLNKRSSLHTPKLVLFETHSLNLLAKNHSISLDWEAQTYHLR